MTRSNSLVSTIVLLRCSGRRWREHKDTADTLRVGTSRRVSDWTTPRCLHRMQVTRRSCACKLCVK